MGGGKSGEQYVGGLGGSEVVNEGTEANLWGKDKVLVVLV
jgi:hypothetical protein